MDVRDFTEDGYRKRMAFLKQLAESCESLWGSESVVCKLSDRYSNVYNSLQGDNRYPIDIAVDAYQACGITPKVIPMRGVMMELHYRKMDCLALISSQAHITSIQSMNIYPLNPYMPPAMY